MYLRARLNSDLLFQRVHSASKHFQEPVRNVAHHCDAGALPCLHEIPAPENSSTNVDARTMTAKEAGRAEAAAGLERKMAAMQVRVGEGRHPRGGSW